jgi:PAS domain S-box-containing protein
MFVFELPTLRMLAVNDAGLRQYGYTREEFLLLTIRDLHPSAEAPMVRLTVLNRGTEPSSSGPWLHRRKDGSEFPVEVSSFDVTWEGRPARCASIADLTGRTRATEVMQERMTALTDPNDTAIEFADLFNLDDIQELQNQFAQATGVASVITHVDGTPITQPSNFTRLCAGIIRQTEAGRCNCFKSDAVLGRCNPTGPIVQPCLSGGLWDAGTSIIVGGRHIANWLVGQVRNEAQDDAQMRAYAQAIGADEDAFMEAYRQVPAMSRERFDAIAQTLFTLSRQLSSTAFQNLQQARSIAERDRAEAALRASESRFRATIDHSGAGYFRIDRQGCYEAVNRSWLRMHGFTAAEQILGRHFSTTHEPHNLPKAEKIVRQGFAGFDLLSGESSHRMADGSVGSHTFSLHPVRREGDVVAVEGFLIDTTSQRRAKADFEMLFDTMLDGFALHDILCDSSGRPIDARYVAVNPAFERHTGLKAAEVIGRTVLQVFPAIEPTWTDAFRRVASSGEAEVFESHSPSLNRFFLISAFRPSPVRFACIMVDITARKLAEEHIREQAALLDVTQDAIFVTDLDRTVSYWNRSAVLLFDLPSDAAGKKIETLTQKDPPPDFAELWQAVVAQREWTSERRRLTPAGRTIDVRIRARVLVDSSGEPSSVLVVFTDITESKQLEVQFLRAQRLESLGALASGVAHDLNNVLTPILIATEMLRPLARAAEDRQTLQLLSDSARRGADIVQQLLLFGRGSDSPRSPLSVGGTIKDVGKMMRGTFPKNIVLSVQAPADLWLVDADRTQLHQVVLNLCVNARDAMPQGGRLMATAENVQVDEAFARTHGGKRTGSHVRLRVQDTGTGIPLELLEKIFDPFFTTKPAGQGTGLGLATALGIVRSHDGILDVRSVVGEGTTFDIYLPAAASAAGVATSEIDRKEAMGQGELILVVDDEESICSALQRTLTSHHYRVMIASDGAEALGVFAQNANQVKLLITNMWMPVMGGAETIRTLRRLNPKLPVIAMSGLSAHRAELEREFGPRLQFLSKPFEADHALRLVREALDAAGAAPP